MFCCSTRRSRRLQRDNTHPYSAESHPDFLVSDMEQLSRNLGYLGLQKPLRKGAAELPWLHTVLCSSLLVCWVLACCYLSALLQSVGGLSC